jgi:uncharacterized membrane protein YesL
VTHDEQMNALVVLQISFGRVYLLFNFAVPSDLECVSYLYHAFMLDVALLKDKRSILLHITLLPVLFLPIGNLFLNFDFFNWH